MALRQAPECVSVSNYRTCINISDLVNNRCELDVTMYSENCPGLDNEKEEAQERGKMGMFIWLRIRLLPNDVIISSLSVVFVMSAVSASKILAAEKGTKIGAKCPPILGSFQEIYPDRSVVWLASVVLVPALSIVIMLGVGSWLGVRGKAGDGSASWQL